MGSNTGISNSKTLLDAIKRSNDDAARYFQEALTSASPCGVPGWQKTTPLYRRPPPKNGRKLWEGIDGVLLWKISREFQTKEATEWLASQLYWTESCLVALWACSQRQVRLPVVSSRVWLEYTTSAMVTSSAKWKVWKNFRVIRPGVF